MWWVTCSAPLMAPHTPLPLLKNYFTPPGALRSSGPPKVPFEASRWPLKIGWDWATGQGLGRSLGGLKKLVEAYMKNAGPSQYLGFRTCHNGS